MKDGIMAILPDEVHVVLHQDEIPTHNDPYPMGRTRVVCVPKEWLKHGERGRYDEWTWKKQYINRLKRECGDDVLSFHINGVKEWMQLENCGLMLKAAKLIGFDLLGKLPELDTRLCAYSHHVDY